MKFLSLFLLTIFSFAFASVNAQQRLPDIALADTSGKILKLSSLKNKVLLIDFWASWCGPCRLNNKAMSRVYKKFAPQGFEIYGVSVDVSIPAWKRAIKHDKTEWKQVIDTRATTSSSLLQTWRIESIPTSYLINDRGEILAINPTRKELMELLPKLLTEE